MPPRRRIVAVVALVAAGVAATLSRTRGGRTGGGGSPADRLRQAVGHDGAEPGTEEWTCECGQAYRVTGEGRHRVHWTAGAPEDDPVMGGRCVACERPLPGERAA
jgi:hypothetical protein